MPDSGKLLHLRIPQMTPTVRVDAGFVEGDEVSPFYDPMIAKLIVRAPDREAALQKLRAALEEYEVVGPTTNIDFLKRLCTSPAFVAGEVETGYIEKHHDELFAKKVAEPEVFAQAALGVLLQQQQQQQEHKNHRSLSRSSSASPTPFSATLGFGQGFQTRTFQLTDTSAGVDSQPTTISIQQTGPSLFNTTVTDSNGITSTYENITSSLHASSKTLSSFFPHTRLDSTFILSSSASSGGSSSISDTIATLFLRGQQYRLQLTPPKWIQKVTGLGAAGVGNTVIAAPMPCTVLRVEVQAGDYVRKNQPLVVIESMKMETVLRCEMEEGAYVKRVPVRKGVSFFSSSSSSSSS